MKKFTITGSVREGTMEMDSELFAKKMKSFLKSAEGHDVSVTYEVVDTPEYWQHKYFHGYLLRDIAEAQGEVDLWYLKHMVLKSKFLFHIVGAHDEIPSRYKKNCRIITNIVPDETNGEHEIIVGFIPSLADLTYDDMRDFIIKCEFLLFEDLQGHLGCGSNKQEALDFRRRAFKDGIR
jgi:hypothetical protein